MSLHALNEHQHERSRQHQLSKTTAHLAVHDTGGFFLIGIEPQLSVDDFPSFHPQIVLQDLSCSRHELRLTTDTDNRARGSYQTKNRDTGGKINVRSHENRLISVHKLRKSQKEHFQPWVNASCPAPPIKCQLRPLSAYDHPRSVACSKPTHHREKFYNW